MFVGRRFSKDSGLSIVFGPGGLSHPHLKPSSLADVLQYVTAPSPVDGVYYNRMTINHFGGRVALTDGEGGVDPATLIVRGTANVAVVDASLIPTIVPAHPADHHSDGRPCGRHSGYPNERVTRSATAGLYRESSHPQFEACSNATLLSVIGPLQTTQ
jgi:GMC oxidoreductase